MFSKVRKLVVGVVLAFLIGCGDYGTEILAPDVPTFETAPLSFHVGETQRLEAYANRQGGPVGSQSFDCDDPTAVSSDPSVLSVERAGDAEVDTYTADEVSAAVTFVHAIAPGTAIITLTCDDRPASLTITVTQ